MLPQKWPKEGLCSLVLSVAWRGKNCRSWKWITKISEQSKHWTFGSYISSLWLFDLFLETLSSNKEILSWGHFHWNCHILTQEFNLVISEFSDMKAVCQEMLTHFYWDYLLCRFDIKTSSVKRNLLENKLLVEIGWIENIASIKAKYEVYFLKGPCVSVILH